MPDTQPSCPLTQQETIDLYFMEHRAKLLDIAAFLDRVDRSNPDNSKGADDFRMKAFRAAVAHLTDNAPDRARRIQEIFSDPTTDPIPAAPMKGALGAWDPATGQQGGKP